MRYRCCQRHLPGKDTTEINCTVDGLEGLEAIDHGQLAVVGDLVDTADGGQHRQRDIGQIGVVHEDKITTNFGQVGSSKGVEVIAEAAHGGVDRRQAGERNVANILEGQVEGSLQIREACFEALSIGVDVEST